MFDIENIKRCAGELKVTEILLNEKKKELSELLIDYEKSHFKGKTYKQHLDLIDVVHHISDCITIKVTKFVITGDYKINDGLTLRVIGKTDNIDEDFSHTLLIYSDCVRGKLPNKWLMEYNILVTECKKYLIENPSQKLRKELGLSDI